MWPKLNILSNDELYSVHLAILDVFERTGVKIHNPQALRLLSNAGAEVDEKRRLAWIPPFIVEEAIRSAPRSVTLYGRNPKYRVKLEKDRSYLVLASTTMNVIDPETGQRVRGRKEYVAKAARVADALTNIHISAQFCLALDCPKEVQDLHELEAVFLNTEKPVMAIVYSPESARDIIKIASLIAGGLDELKKKPILFIYSEPSSPLEHDEKYVDILIEFAKEGLPALYAPCVQAGATGPVTIAGTLVQSFVESFTGLIITQLVRRGTPFICGVVSTVMDMHTGVMTYGSPELSIINAAAAQLAQYYKLPFFGTGGPSDSKLPDEQAIAEAATSLLTAMLTGTNLIHDVGYIESGATGSLETVVIIDELADMYRRIINGMEVNDETLATDVISEVGPGGHYLAHKHSLKYVKKEHWMPKLIDRTRYEMWSNTGRKDMVTRAREKISGILKDHRPEPLPEDVIEEIRRIIESRRPA
jgi:trimethylamine--corrinoid protein Co-methyltransferase